MAIRFDQIELAGAGHDLYPTIAATGSGQLVQLQSSHGYLQLGSNNSSYAHFQTDRADFYFNAPVKFDGSIGAYGGTETASFASYIDSQDTNYFVNPNGSSSLYTPVTMSTNDTTLTFQDAGTNAFQIKTSAGDELYLGSNNNYQLQMTTSGHVNTQGDWRFGANFVKVGNSATYNSDDGSWGSRFVVSSTVHARIDCAQDANAVRASWFTHTGHLYSTFGTVTAHDMRLISHNATRQFLYNGYSQESASYRAPIFYDSQSTGYYLNPNDKSNLYSIKLNGYLSGTSAGCAEIGRNHAYDTMELKGYGAEFMIGAQHTSININYRTCNNGASGHTPTDWYWRAGSPTSFANMYMAQMSSSTNARAPIFYDSNDTAYYLNPASTSNLNDVEIVQLAVDSYIYHKGDTDTYLGFDTTDSIRFVTGNNERMIINSDGIQARELKGVRTNLATSEGWAETNAWSVGTQTGYYGGNFTINGSSDENNICFEEGPTPNSGSSSITRKLMWKCRYNGSGNGADGGWNKTITGIDYNKAHISVVYVKRIADGNGNFYHGTTTCLNLSDGSSNGNPYFIAMGSQSIPLNVWCVSIGYLQANNDTASSAGSSYSGMYRLDTGERIHGYTDFRLAASTTSQHRAFLYYSSNTATEVWMTAPGFYEVNGHEPNINELLMRPEDRVDSIRADVDLRSPIYYDSNNTAYYLNPDHASTSLSTTGKWFMQGSHSSARLQLNYAHGSDATNSGALTAWVSEPGITYESSGIGGNIHVSGQYYGRAYNDGYGVYVRFDKGNGNLQHCTTTGNAGVSGGQGTVQWYNDASGNSFSTTSCRAPLFYDSSDTTYYSDPAGTSNQRNIHIKQGSTLNQYRSGDAAFAYRDARAEGSYAAIYKGTYTGSAYGNYFEYWYDGNSYHSISCANDKFNFNAPISVTGQITASADVVAYSDERLKKDIKTLDGSKVYDMRGVSFTKDDKKGSGVIAQELEKIAPELVSDNNEYKAVAYGNITGYLIEAIKDLKAEIEELKKQIK